MELGFEAMESRGRCWLWLPCLEGMESLWVEWEAERWTLLVGKEEREGRRELVPPLEFEFVFVRRGSTVAIVSSWRWSCIGRNWVRESSLVAAIDRASFAAVAVVWLCPMQSICSHESRPVAWCFTGM